MRAGNVTFLPLPPRRSQIPNPNQLEAVERTSGELQLGISQLARRVAFVVGNDLYTMKVLSSDAGCCVFDA